MIARSRRRAKRFIVPGMTRRPLEQEFEADSPGADAIPTRTYVEPDCSMAGSSAAERLPLALHMDQLLGGANRRCVLLGDPGMGKTSFLLNYLETNRKRRADKRMPMVMASLHRLDALAALADVPSKRDTVVLLDGFDEDTRAIQNRERRLQEIVDACRDFKCVVVTSTPEPASSDAEIFGKHAFETVQLCPFSAEQIDEYLQRRIPWHQRKQRRQAKALVASMGDLATRPNLLSLVPELVSAGRQITELFELYEFMVERWLERERSWIDPDALRALAEQVAVAIHVRSTTGGIDRVYADEVVCLSNAETASLEQWRPTVESLLERDALGRFSFSHPTILDHLFVSACLRGEKRCLAVRWNNSMRRLFVSGTNVLQKRHADAALRPLLARNFSATGLFPLSDPHTAPRRLETPEILDASSISESSNLNDGPAWDPTLYVLEGHVDDSLYLCDRSSDRIFFVPTDWRRVESGAVDPESARLFLATRAEGDSQLANLNELRRDNRSNWRLPTLEEIDFVFLLNQRHAFLSPEQYVWCGDHTMDGERLVARMHPAAKDLDTRLNPIGVRKVAGSNGAAAGYFVLSMPPLGVRNHRANFDASFPGLLIRVSQGAAQEFAIGFGGTDE